MRYYEIIETSTTRPPRRPAGTKPPLTPEQARRAAERRNAAQRKLRDENLRHSAKVGDLQATLNQGP